MNTYQRLQIGLVVLLVALFTVCFTLDLLAFPMSEFAKNTMVAIWSIILLLVDAKGLAEIIQQSTKENAHEKTDPGSDTAAS
jgi:hypothetical protein